jgi:hypothetical protein
MQLAGIMSIEDLSTCPDHLVGQVSREAASVKKLAIEWLGRKDSSTDIINIAEQKAAMEAYARTTEAQMKALQDSNQSLMAEVEAMRRMMGNGVAMQVVPMSPTSETAFVPNVVLDDLAFHEHVPHRCRRRLDDGRGLRQTFAP